jgi:flagellar basal-body rod protein FlgC
MSTLGASITASASALTTELVRIEAATSNLANAESTRGADGQPYRRRDVVVASQPVSEFDAALEGSRGMGVRVVDVVEDQAAFKRRYEPSHPHADEQGYVAMPNVDVAEEMVNLVGASRAYQANLAAVGIIRDLVQSALELGR